jgi:Putative polyhydroxyalkanoic acid system protein (PHA_gran_rgn)
VKITVEHGSSKEEAKRAVNRSLDDMFTNYVPLPVKLLQQQRSWSGDTLTFSLIAKMGLMSTPITGTVHVSDRDVAIDVNLGILERLIPADKARQAVTTRLKGLLK